MTPEFIIGDGKLWSSYGWICLGSYSVMKSSFFSLYNSYRLTSFFSCPVIVYQWGDFFHEYGPYYEYGYRVHQIVLSLILDKGNNVLLDEGLCLWMYLYFYWIPLALIHIFDCSEGVVFWVPFHVCRMVIWRGNFVLFYHVALKFISHLCCWVHIQDNFVSGMVLKMLYVFKRIWVANVD